MDQLKVVVYVIFIFSTVQGATIQVPCKNDTDCMLGQCCYHEPEFLVASRRQAALTLDIGANPVEYDTGRIGATIQVPCKNDTDCMPGQCCYHEPEFLVASRRQAALTLDIGVNPVKHDTGVCENYHQESEQCYYLEKVNGHCGCAQGLTCQFDPPCVRPTDQTNRHLRGAPCPWVQGSEKCMRIK